jgi:hypothetical protein
MRKTNRVKNQNHVKFNVDKESKNKRATRRNNNKKNTKNRTINAALRIKNRTLTPMPETTETTATITSQNATMSNSENQMPAT